jgi:hypothetical protein
MTTSTTQIEAVPTRRSHLTSVPTGCTSDVPRSDGRWAPIVIRMSVAGDRRALRQLAYLDSQRPAAEDMLLAEQAGEIMAAITLSGETTIADPFRPTADAVALLRLRASQLNRSRHAA